MARCETCGNEYAKCLVITQGDKPRTFDSFECAIHAMAPRCEHCGCVIIGHGFESQGSLFCCEHCSRQSAGRPAAG